MCYELFTMDVTDPIKFKWKNCKKKLIAQQMIVFRLFFSKLHSMQSLLPHQI